MAKVAWTEPALSDLYDIVLKDIFAMKYNVLLRHGNESGFVATVPALPGCVSQGKTKRETLRNIREAMVVYIEVLLEA